jgi:hypothetical protein
MLTEEELHPQKQMVVVRKAKRKVLDLSKFKSQINEDLLGFTGREAYEIKQLNTTYRFNSTGTPKMGLGVGKGQRELKKREIVGMKGERANSSMM